jgi:hypothetical protein
MTQRSWTWIDENSTLPEEEREENQAVLDELIKEWNALEAEREHEQYALSDTTDAEADFVAEQEDENPGFAAQFYRQRNARSKARDLKQSALEDAMGRLGARLMRPYEHWNEEEHMMEWLETRYDSYGDD